MVHSDWSLPASQIAVISSLQRGEGFAHILNPNVSDFTHHWIPRACSTGS